MAEQNKLKCCSQRTVIYINSVKGGCFQNTTIFDRLVLTSNLFGFSTHNNNPYKMKIRRRPVSFKLISKN